MVESFAPPDIEKALVGYYARTLDVRVATDVPNPRPRVWLQVNRIGGVSPNIIQDAPIVLLQAWGARDDDRSAGAAADLAHDAYRALSAARGSWIAPYCWLYSASLSGPVNNSDTETETPRYQLTATLRTRMLVREESPQVNG